MSQIRNTVSLGGNELNALKNLPNSTKGFTTHAGSVFIADMRLSAARPESAAPLSRMSQMSIE